MSEDSDAILREVRGDVAWITLNRPERLNAFDGEMMVALKEAVDESVRETAIVITGAGRGFCAGGYLNLLANPDAETVRKLHRSTLQAFEAIRRSPRPVIAAVNGPAAGGGNELLIVCDFAVASDKASFGQTGPRIGSAGVNGATNLLAIQIGEKRAKEMVMLCRRYSAAEAEAMGLVNKVVPHDELEAEVNRWTDEVRALSPRYLEIAKYSSNIWWDESSHDILVSLETLLQTVGSPDMLEGASAFIEKRVPDFRP